MDLISFDGLLSLMFSVEVFWEKIQVYFWVEFTDTDLTSFIYML